MASKQFDASKLGEPNSDLYWRTVISASGPKLALMASQYAQAAKSANVTDSVHLVGPKELVAANMRSLAKLMSDNHVSLKVISFFSGEYPNATMLYQAKQEPEDVIELSYLAGFEELLKQFEEELESMGDKAAVVRGTDAPAMALIIDDLPALLRELRGRGDDHLEVLELIPKFKALGVGLYAGSTEEDIQPMFHSYVSLKSFDGYTSNI